MLLFSQENIFEKVAELNEFYLVKNLLPLGVLVVILGTVIATALINPQKFNDSKSSVIVAVAASMAIVFLGINVVLNTISIDFQVDVAKNKITKLSVDRLWVYPNQKFCEKTKVRPEFYASLYYNNLDLYKLTQNLQTKITIESALEEQYVSILLFQCWEDYLMLRRFDKAGDVVWLVNFLHWAQSPYLKENFDRLKYNYADLTIRLADLLFEYAHKLPIPTTTPETYNKLAQEMLEDPRLIQIYKDSF